MNQKHLDEPSQNPSGDWIGNLDAEFPELGETQTLNRTP
jgi:hypothetical protein